MFCGKRLKDVRKLKGLTQKELGKKVGFSESTADIRIAQYEKGDRSPKEECLHVIARELDVAPEFFEVPDMESDIIMHTFFALEDTFGFRPFEKEGATGIFLKDVRTKECRKLSKGFIAWKEKLKQLEKGEISKSDYDEWRYHLKTECFGDDMEYCIYCGERVSGAGKFCSNCGKKLL